MELDALRTDDEIRMGLDARRADDQKNMSPANASDFYAKYCALRQSEFAEFIAASSGRLNNVTGGGMDLGRELAAMIAPSLGGIFIFGTVFLSMSRSCHHEQKTAFDSP
jgi:hypothetical protein